MVFDSVAGRQENQATKRRFKGTPKNQEEWNPLCIEHDREGAGKSDALSPPNSAVSIAAQTDPEKKWREEEEKGMRRKEP